MDDDSQQEPGQSVANRVLSTFIAAVGEEGTLSEVAARLRPVLLDGDTVNEASLRQALFGDAS
jgi:NAD-dependent DNA ligase